MKKTSTEPLRARRRIGDRIHARFAALGGLELPEIPREPMCQSPTFDELAPAPQCKEPTSLTGTTANR